MTALPAFSVVSGPTVARILDGNERAIIDVVRDTYLAHEAGNTENPASQFLRLGGRPRSRIIALPASITGEGAADGIKWIASYPDNVAAGLPRASSVLILNDPSTGFPLACLEASLISASRTAASAALAARVLSTHRTPARTLGIVGAGPIAHTVYHYLTRIGFDFDRVTLFDVLPERAEALREKIAEAAPHTHVAVGPTLADTFRSGDLVVCATVAAEPHVFDDTLFSHHPLVLHISLRDLAPEILLGAINIVDDVDHCLTAATSPHLAEQLSGNREFVTGTLAGVITGRVQVPGDRTVIFSPFGLGVLDMALARFVYESATATGSATVIPDFFPAASSPGTR